MNSVNSGPTPAEQCTIVIPVHNRQNFLPRLTQYLADFQGQIIITDSSPRPVPPAHIRAPGARYIHVPAMPYAQKMRETLSGVTTPYLVDCPDDDFILKQSIIESVSIMNADQSIGCVRGRTIRMLGAQCRTYPAQEWARHAKNVALNKPENGPIRQLLGIMRWAVGMNHVVYRREVLLRGFEVFASYKHLRPILFVDRILRYVAASSGGMKFISRPMIVRDGTRLVYRPEELPEDVEFEVPYADLPRRLREIGDPLAKMMADRLGTDDVAALEAFNQKLFSHNFSAFQTNYAPHWLAERVPVALTAQHQAEVDDVLKVVRRHRTAYDAAIGTYFNLREDLGKMRRRLGIRRLAESRA